MNGSTILQLPVISDNDLLQVAQLISDLHAPSTSGNPELAHRLQAQLQSVISSDIAWSLLPGLNRSSQDPIVRFYAAQSAQTKIARDWESLPEGLRLKELEIVLDACVETASLGGAYSVVLRKLFSCVSPFLAIRAMTAPLAHPGSPFLADRRTHASNDTSRLQRPHPSRHHHPRWSWSLTDDHFGILGNDHT